MTTLQIVALSVGIPLAYIFGMGFTFAGIPEDFKDEWIVVAWAAAVVWPVTVVARGGHAAALAFSEWRTRPRIPKAQVRK